LGFLIAMKLLLDQGLPLSAAALLRDAGIDTTHVGEIGMSEALDRLEKHSTIAYSLHNLRLKVSLLIKPI
jgi:predicted nuclease of predicted toxin-antitoxin system